LFPTNVARAWSTGASVAVESCQVCGSKHLECLLSLGYMPPVNQMVAIGDLPRQSTWFPTPLLYCGRCELVQLGLIVDPAIIFPPEYPYTSGTTRILRDNFADLYSESSIMLGLGKNDFIVDIGSNDGTLVSNFLRGGHRVLGIEPTNVSRIANDRGIPTLQSYFTADVAREVKSTHGFAKIITAANCFAHIEDVHATLEGVIDLLAPDGVFISESHYLVSLLERLQYDTIYHEHLRYYSVTSLSNLLSMHSLDVFHVRAIPSHGGSIRAYAARRGTQPIQASVKSFIEGEPHGDTLRAALAGFRNKVMLSKLQLLSLIRGIKEEGGRICGISAPSRASTLVNYIGLDEAIIDYVCEIQGSLKIGKYIPGTQIPVVDESQLVIDQPECAIIFSWHIADEIAPKLRDMGYRGTLVSPLPVPRIL